MKVTTITKGAEKSWRNRSRKRLLNLHNLSLFQPTAFLVGERFQSYQNLSITLSGDAIINKKANTMANEYIYIPVNSDEMSEFAERFAKAKGIPVNQILANKCVSGKGKAMYRWIDKCLSKLTKDDTLYLVTHGTGAADALTIGSERNMGKNKQKRVNVNGNDTWEGGEWKSYTPDQLTSTLTKEGLPSTFVNLHVCACGGGYEGKMAPWASRLKDAMKQSFPKVKVTGYQGAFSVSPTRVAIIDKGALYPMNERAVTF
ncbi:hypothetical protein KP814_08955 [Hahella sp. HN01]|nr:hypothetical protein [Hahella sp. HN01]